MMNLFSANELEQIAVDGVTGLRATDAESELLLAWLRQQVDGLPSAKHRRRDQAVKEFAGYFSGSKKKIAEDMAADLLRYECSAWKRDMNAATSPYEAGTLSDLRFCILKGSDHARGRRGESGAIGFERIRQILRSGNKQTLSITSFGGETSGMMDKSRSDMNAVLPIERFVSALAESETGKQIVADVHAEAVRKRKSIVAALAALDARADKESPALEKAVKAGIDGVREVEKALKAANDRLNAASLAKSAANAIYTVERARLEGLLREGCDEELLNAFRSEMLDELDAARKLHEGGWKQTVSPVSGHTVMLGFTNKASVAARVAAIRAAMDEAEGLRLAVDQSAIPDRLAQLRAALPAIGRAVGPGVEA